MTLIDSVIKTRNEQWGFFGTIAHSDLGIDPQLAWNVAIEALRDRGIEPELARQFLDSTYGRHIADCLSGPDFNVNDAMLACFGSERRLQNAIARYRDLCIIALEAHTGAAK